MATIDILNGSSVTGSLEVKEVRLLDDGISTKDALRSVRGDGFDEIFISMNDGRTFVAYGQLPNESLKRLVNGTRIAISGEAGIVVGVDEEMNTEDDVACPKAVKYGWFVSGVVTVGGILVVFFAPPAAGIYGFAASGLGGSIFVVSSLCISNPGMISKPNFATLNSITPH